MTLSVVCNGVHLATQHYVSPVQVTHRWGPNGGGFHEAAWSMETAYSRRPRYMTPGAVVEIRDQTSVIGTGRLQNADWSEGSFVATGIYRDTESFSALNTLGATTSVPDEAIDGCITRGLGIFRVSSINSASFTEDDETQSINTLESLLSADAQERNLNWWVSPDRLFHVDPDPTAPRWHLTPGAVELGVSAEEYASHVLVRYETAGSTFATAIAADADAAARYGRREHLVDATALGVVTPTRANALAASILAGAIPRPGWTSTMTASANTLLTTAGRPAALGIVRAGQMVRAHGLPDDSQWMQGRAYQDVVIAESVYVDGSDVVTLTPKGAVARTLAEITEEQLNAASQGFSA